MQTVRQGDVLLIKVADAPANEASAIEREEGQIIVAKGEATGHAHTISAPDVVMYEGEAVRWLDAPDEFLLEHQEHDTLTIESGS